MDHSLGDDPGGDPEVDQESDHLTIWFPKGSFITDPEIDQEVDQENLNQEKERRKG